MATATPEAARERATAVPTTMKAAAIDRFGLPDMLAIHTLPVPGCGEHDVLIAVQAAGVGIWDARIRDGSWASGTEKFPLVLGADGAGVVAAKGTRVRRFDVGDRVWASAYQNPSGGFYAEYVSAPADSVGMLPPELDMLHAGAGCVTGLTAMQGIHDVLQVRRNETVLIFGATGAVGTLAVQIAKHQHAYVLATATGRSGSALVQNLGADRVFDARNSEALDRLNELLPDGIDAVLALAGGAALEKCLDRVRSGGRVAYPNGVEPEPRRRRTFRVVSYDGESGPNQFARLGRLFTDADLQVPIAATYPLSQAARAHTRIERGSVTGRIALRIRRG